MVIEKRPVPTEKSVEDFINAAPDGRKKRIIKGNKVQITFTIDETILDKLDEVAKNNGQSRSNFICLAIKQALNKGLHLD
jgi:hypothetical protein